MSRGLLGLVLVATWLAPAVLRATPTPVARAAQHFERGEKLYEQGQFEAAVREFLDANRLAPRSATVFNIARCYENLGNSSEALAYYGILLKMTREPTRRAEIQRRMALIRSRLSVGVLVTTEPPGASITVDARPLAEAQQTPAVVKLSPGPHVLQLRRDGSRLAVARVEVQVGRQEKVAVTLQPLQPAPAPVARECPRKRCPAPPRLPLVDARKVHVRLYLLSAVSLTDDTGLMPGPGVQVHATFRSLMVGLRFLAFVIGERKIDTSELPPEYKDYDRRSYRRYMLEADFGWMWAWRTMYLYLTGSAGGYSDRGIFAKSDDDFVREKFAFSWGGGGGVEVKATSWLSLGAALRFGMAHGDRVDRDNPDSADDVHHWPFGIFWMSVTLHL